MTGINLEVAPGEGLVLIGPNGSGKSTLLECILRLEEATSGRVLVGGVDTASAGRRRLREVRRRVGMVFQKFHLVGNLSVFHNVLHGALGRSRGLHYWTPATAPRAERRKAMECLERVGLADRARQRADTLSGGQQQRTALARALMQDPEIMLADEPVASLDPRAGRQVMDLLWEIGRERRMTVVCAIHDLELALEYADRVVGLREGWLVLDSTADEVNRQELDRLYDARPAKDAATF